MNPSQDPSAWIADTGPEAVNAFRVRVQLVREGAPRTFPAFASSAHVHALFRDMGQLDRELFAVVLLDTKQRMTGFSVVSVGTLDASLVHPREVFKPAIVGNAASVICLHNHPSGDPKPSKDDHEITVRLAEAGRTLGIPVLDHVVIGTDGYTSFKDRGYL